MNFSFKELCYSDTAIILGINNMPKDTEKLDNMLNLMVECLQPIRDKIGKPMRISSGYRCELLNRHVGGVDNSQHTKGQAVDFTILGMSIYEIIDFIKKSGVEYDQLINEYNKWVHISYNKGKNRKQILSIR